MVAIIDRGKNLIGALYYNHCKVEKGKAQVLFAQKIIEAPDGSYNMQQLSRSFEHYLLANRRTEKPIFHISLNPDPKDRVRDNDFENIAQEYMKKMGYGNQPYIVFKHTDIERTHIHIVSICVDEEGRKISDKFEKRRSMDVCRTLEKEFGLISAVGKRENSQNQIFKPIDYKEGDIKSQMASILRHLPKYYQFQTFGAYNALLSLFNITAEEVKGNYNGIEKKGIVYFALNDKGEKTSNPFKASLFGKSAGLALLESHFEQSRMKLKDSGAKGAVRGRIESVMRAVSNESEFKKKLVEQGVSVVVRRNVEGRIYGITFIDHQSRCVCNGSELGKHLSANVFNDWWNNGNKADLSEREDISLKNTSIGQEANQGHNFFVNIRDEDIAYTPNENNIIEVLGGLLPENHGEDFQEIIFANQIKRKVKGRTPKY